MAILEAVTQILAGVASVVAILVGIKVLRHDDGEGGEKNDSENKPDRK